LRARFSWSLSLQILFDFHRLVRGVPITLRAKV
jgi:hypothetical protein